MTEPDQPREWRLSPSAVNLAIECPRRFWFRRILRLPDPPGPAAMVGTAAHATCEHTPDDGWDDRPALRARVAATLDEMLELDDYRALVPDCDARQRTLQWIWRCVQRAARYHLTRRPRVLRREGKVELDVDGIPVVGFIDFEEGLDHDRFRATDYKSGVLKPMYMNSKWRQGGLYQAMLAELRGRPAEPTRFVFLGGDQPEIADTPPTWVDFAVEDLHKVHDLVTTADPATPWEPNPGPLCGWCPYLTRCRAGLDWFADEAPLLKPATRARWETSCPAVAKLADPDQVAQHYQESL